MSLGYAKKVLPLYVNLGNRSMEAEILNNIGGFLDAMGQSHEGLPHLLQANLILSEIKDKKREAVSLNTTGIVYSNIGEMSTALEYLNRALLLRRETCDKAGEARTIANLASIYTDIGDRRESAKLSDNKSSIAYAYFRTGQASAQLGDNPAAAENYQRALDIFREIGLSGQTADVLYYSAKLEAAGGKLVSAAAKAREAVESVESVRFSFSSGDLRADYLASVQNYYALHTDFLVRLHRQQPTNGFDALAFQAAEKARARSLLESLGESKWDVRSGASAELLGREKRLR